MSSISDYLENAFINHFLRNSPVTGPTTLYLALYTSNPTDADTGTEVTGGDYARKPVTLTAPANGVTSNTADVEFPIATANWGNVTHVGVRSALTGGNLLLHAPLVANKPIEAGDQFRFPAGKLDFTID